MEHLGRGHRLWPVDHRVLAHRLGPADDRRRRGGGLPDCHLRLPGPADQDPKEQIYNRFTLTPEGDEPLPGAVHFPNNPDIFDLTEAQQLTAEEQVEKWVDGRKKILWDSKKRRNEALDCFVYALAALRISISRWQLDLSALLASLQEEDGAATNKKTLADYARALSGEDE